MHHVAIYTGNFERVRDYHTTVLGLPIVGEAPAYNIVFVGCGSNAIEIVERKELPTPSGVGGWVHVAFEIDNIDAVHAELVSRGVAFHLGPTSLPVEMPILRIAFFRDPDGNELELYQSIGSRYPQIGPSNPPRP